MKSFVLLGCIAALAVAQRPFYAGTSQKVYPELASRFKDTDSESSLGSNTIANRLGEEDSQTTIKIPIDARGDADLVKWLNTWPRENRPFWLLNADQIESFRDPEGTRNRQQQIRSRSSASGDSASVDSRPIRPLEQPRPSFLSSLGRT